KSGLIHLLPSFHGHAGEDPHKHLKEFHVVCSSMKPTGVTEEQIKLRAFPFSLKDSAKDWLYYLPSGSITTWNNLKTMFLEKYFPASRAANIRKEICGIRQNNGESLYEYWERFKKLCASCPHHQISDQLLIQYFYEGLFPTDRSMIDAASGGALVDKTPDAARTLIANMAANSQQFGNRLVQPSKQQYRQPFPSKQQPVQSSSAGMNLEEIVKSLATNTLQFQQQTQQFQQETRASIQETKASIQNLERQMGQLATTVSRLESQSSGKLPSQTVVNPRENASAIVLRSVNQEKEGTNNNEKSQGKSPNPTDYEPVPPFPQALSESIKGTKDEELYETFKNCEVNIPLLDAIKQVPRYAKFLKELCTTKRKQRSSKGEKVLMGKNVSAVIQSKLPEKCKDPGMFTIPCMIGDTKLEKAMLDLGASINVMPYSMYASLKLGPLNKTSVVIQLADRSNAYPRSVIEDVLLQVNNLIFPTDFYVLDMENNDHSAPILLGRPFLKTAKTKIDIHSGTLTMEFDGNVVTFNIYDAMKYPGGDNSAYSVDIIDSLVEEVFEFNGEDKLEVVICEHLEKGNNEFSLSANLYEVIASLNHCPKLRQQNNVSYMALPASSEKLLPSVVQAPIPALKPLPEHLKYAFLGENKTFPVIISTKLSAIEEEKLSKC
ncbi:PREDICTED: uncharacterized protein LOC109167852, partial [Ipomoea nil]|uniref:uncharacterized protein LOC109167852 n=1 Tax=Ipomoea nil TaxID=35883 RepID=UPI000901ABED